LAAVNVLSIHIDVINETDRAVHGQVSNRYIDALVEVTTPAQFCKEKSFNEDLNKPAAENVLI
jgi:hypothetical protein